MEELLYTELIRYINNHKVKGLDPRSLALIINYTQDPPLIKRKDGSTFKEPIYRNNMKKVFRLMASDGVDFFTAAKKVGHFEWLDEWLKEWELQK